MKAVEARLWTIYCGNNNHSSVCPIAPDTGLDRIYVDTGKLYVRETVPAHFSNAVLRISDPQSWT